MSDQPETPVEQPEETPEPLNGKPEPSSETPDNDKPERVSSNSLWEDKVRNLHKDLSNERKTVKTLRQENDTLKKSVGTFELKAKKSAALDTALSEIGEDFEVSSDRLSKLKGMIDSMQDGDGLSEAITDAVDLVKTPRQKNKFGTPFSPGVPPNDTNERVQFQPGQSLTPYQMGQLSNEQLDAHIKSRQAR